MNNFYDPPKLDRRMEQRIRVIVELGRRRDRLLERRVLDLVELASLVDDYAAAGMPCAAAALRGRLEHYRKSIRAGDPQ
jgi:hypothetical protein